MWLKSLRSVVTLIFKFKYCFSVLILCLLSAHAVDHYIFSWLLPLASKTWCCFLTPPSFRVSSSQSPLDCLPQGPQCQGSILGGFSLCNLYPLLLLTSCLKHCLCAVIAHYWASLSMMQRELPTWPGNLYHCPSHLNKYFFQMELKSASWLIWFFPLWQYKTNVFSHLSKKTLKIYVFKSL